MNEETGKTKQPKNPQLNRNGLYEKARKQFAKHPKRLWTRASLRQVLVGTTEKQTYNLLYTHWKDGKLFLHKERTPEGEKQFALELPEELREPYVQKYFPTGPTKSDKSLEGIRQRFAEIQNQLAALEDSVANYVETFEEREKELAEKDAELNKVKNLLSRLNL